jgi:hypothetical protein
MQTIHTTTVLQYHNLVIYLAGNMGRRMNTVVWSHFTILMAPDGSEVIGLDVYG